MRAVLAFAFIACSSSAPHEPAPVPSHGEPPRDARATPATACPAAFGATDPCTPAEPRSVVVRQRTDFGHGPGPVEDVASLEWSRCTYPQGTCACQREPDHCSGGAAVQPPPPGWQPPPYHWVCTPALRADGCPGVPPRAGEPCTVARGCNYCITSFTCDRGAWSVPIFGPPAP